MRRFLAMDLSGPEVLLDKESSHHLLRVSGIAPGESVELVDGLGAHVEATLLDSQRGRARLRVDRRLPVIERKEERLLCVGLLRAVVFDQVIRQATEMGVDRIIPIQAERSVARSGNPERWDRVARAAMIQCGRSLLPTIEVASALQEVLKGLGSQRNIVVLSPGAPLLEPLPGPCAVLIGPEGGWSPQELELAQSHGARLAGLGELTLRAETAVVATLARLQS
jgi:16S rRNA (uracil1498-N3)-methyltransferase